MTNSSRKFLLPLLLIGAPALAFAQATTQKPAAPARPAAAAPAPRPRVAVPVQSPSQRWQQQADQQRLQNRQNQNAVQEQLRQGNLNQQRNTTTDPALRTQLDNADRSQQQLYRARQDEAARRYQNQQLQQNTAPARPTSTP